MVRVGILGMGFIGQQHFATWADVEGAEVVAVADKEIERVAASAKPIGGNIGDATPIDLSSLRRHDSLETMLAAGGLDIVDVCLPTFLHPALVEKALAGGVHVVCEKPMALDVDQCDEMLAAAEESGKMLFLAHCIRFWPEYEVLARMIREGELGRLVSLKLTRVSPSPFWSQGGWLNDPDKSGGALLDLHIHDADFIMSVLGMPPAVFSCAGSIKPAGPKVDHVLTHYLYDDMTVTAEGGWAMPPNFPFEMAFEALGEKGCLTFSTSDSPTLTFYAMDGGSVAPEFRAVTGYLQELEYFAGCVRDSREPQRVTAFDGREAVRLIMAEKNSIRSGGIVDL
jgi:predicted dehydrogenase